MAKGRKTGGRQKGTQNKMTATLKEMILNALDRIGGESYLIEQSERNPTAFIALLGKLLPSEIKASLTSAPQSFVEINVDAARYVPDSRESASSGQSQLGAALKVGEKNI